MDFTGRSSQSPQSPEPQFSGSTGNAAGNNNKRVASRPAPRRKWARWGAGVLGLLVVALVVAVILVIGLGGQKAESQYVDKNKLQAVFLQTGQVYFGKIKSLNSKYFVVSSIYYLQTASTGTSATTAASTANTSVSLVKLGCELHAPYDQMVINRDQVTFWENLQDDGQVAKAVATFQKDNPNGQKCTDQSAAPNTTSNVQSTGTGTATGGTGTTSTTPTTTTTKP